MIVVDYDAETGRIRGLITYPFDDYELMYPGGLFLGNSAEVSDLRHYVKDGIIEERPTLPIVLDDNVLRGVPEGSTVVIDYENYTADGSDIELEFGHPGDFQVRVEKFPYQDFEVVYHED